MFSIPDGTALFKLAKPSIVAWQRYYGSLGVFCFCNRLNSLNQSELYLQVVMVQEFPSFSDVNVANNVAQRIHSYCSHLKSAI